MEKKPSVGGLKGIVAKKDRVVGLVKEKSGKALHLQGLENAGRQQKAKGEVEEEIAHGSKFSGHARDQVEIPE
eukprot:CAMPEP_0177657120 /NCGR_PEP_ID=MMETSP0447-20121125/15998_1 /TAXON_ID=0 /ORGANISM="Stygamoeba regulata, Strain BSH-02190019" /LENGTH=72 /DNA_ID=CAMNT_0019161419 /DNA_START=57 /DNA_END=275 /DNA_ORIENTATION=-